MRRRGNAELKNNAGDNDDDDDDDDADENDEEGDDVDEKDDDDDDSYNCISRIIIKMNINNNINRN